MTKIVDEEGNSLDFRCDKCGGNRLEEVMVNAIVTSVVDSIGVDGDVEYGAKIIDDGDVSHYQCVNCGKVFDFVEPQDLVEYLVSQEKETD